MCVVHAVDGVVNVEQWHCEQNAQRQSQLHAIHVVEASDGVADEPMPHLERLDPVDRRRRAVRPHDRRRAGGGYGNDRRTRAAAVAMAPQHGRVPVGSDRFRFQRGHVTVDRPKLLVQPHAVHDELHFRGAHARVLRVHQRGEQEHGRVAEPPVQQVHFVRAHRHDQGRAHGRHGDDGQTPGVGVAAVRREVQLVLFDLILVLGHRAPVHVHDRRSGDQTRDGHGPGEHALHDYRVRRTVTLVQNAHDPRRFQITVHARRDQCHRHQNSEIFPHFH